MQGLLSMRFQRVVSGENSNYKTYQPQRTEKRPYRYCNHIRTNSHTNITEQSVSNLKLQYNSLRNSIVHTHESISTEAKMSLLKQPVYGKKKHKRFLNSKHNVITQLSQQQNTLAKAERQRKLAAERIKFLAQKINQNTLHIQQPEVNNKHGQLQEQSQCPQTLQITQQNQKSEKKRYSSVLCEGEIRKSVPVTQRYNYNSKSSNKRVLCAKSATHFIDLSESRRSISRRKERKQEEKPVYRTSQQFEARDTQQLIRRNCLFLMEFMKRKERNEQRLRSGNQPHIGHISETTSQCKIIVTTAHRKPRASSKDGGEKARRSYSTKNVLCSGNGGVISPW